MTARPDLWHDLAAAFEAAAAPRLALDEWAAKYRRVVGGPFPGPWNPKNAPMSLEPMRALSDRRVGMVTVASPAQLMKSELCINAAVGTAAYGEDVLFYEPDREVLAEFVRDRIRPALFALDDGTIIEAPDAAALKRRDSALVIRLAGGGKILGLTPMMKTGKSAYTAPTVILDELDKMADPTMVTVAESRTTVYGSDASILAVSTPTVDAPGLIWRLWTEGSRGRWHGRCPHCRDLVRVDWSRVKFDKDEDGFWLPATWSMPCESCGACWTESDRQRGVRAGEYVHDDPDNPHRSFHIPGTAHLWRTVQSIVAQGAIADRGARIDNTWANYQMFVNERLGEPWTDEFQGLSARRMQRTTYSLGSRGKDDLGELDRRTVLVTAGCDTGGRAIYSEFVAWGIDPPTGQALCWGLQYRIVGGGPEDDIEDPELWREFFRLVDESRWRHAGYPGQVIGAHRVLVDAGYRPDVVRHQLKERFAHEIRDAGMEIVAPYGARILPSRGKSIETGNHLIDLSDGTNRKPRQRTQYPALVGLHTNMLKDAIYEVLLRDRRLPDAAPRQVMWPVDQEAKGYTQSYFREFSNEVRNLHRTPQGKIVTRWEVKAGQAKKNEAWDCRIYATGAAITHCQTFGAVGLQAGLLSRAVAQGTRNAGRWTDDEMANMRKHLDILGASDYASGDNVTRLR